MCLYWRANLAIGIFHNQQSPRIVCVVYFLAKAKTREHSAIFPVIIRMSHALLKQSNDTTP